MPQPKLLTQSDREFLSCHRWIIVVGFLWILANFLLGKMFDIGRPSSPSGIPVYTTFGLVASQFAFLGFFLALFPASFLFRFFVTIAMGSFLFVPLWLGHMLFGSRGDVQQLMQELSRIPGMVLGCALPFAMAKHFLNWRLGFDEMKFSDESKLTVSSLLIGTALVAGAISLIQVSEKSTQRETLVVIAICVGVGLVLFIPYALILLRSRFHWIWLLAAGMVSFLMAEIVFRVGSGVSSNFPNPFWEHVGFSISIAATFISFGAAVIALKAGGMSLDLSQTHRSFESEQNPSQIAATISNPSTEQ